MRKLLYVPIIHTRGDMGSLGPALERKSASQLGDKLWTEHQEAVAGFWRAIEDYLLSLEDSHLVIYQDGLAADGELGRRVVEEAARRGSLNHGLLLHLVNRGADIRKTEEPSLLLEELGLARQEAGAEGPSQGYKARRARLLEARDRFIARTIAETLKEGETAVLFIGAYHDVLPRLPEDISVEPLKEPDKVRLYLEELTSGKDPQRWRHLADYLASPIPPAFEERRHR